MKNNTMRLILVVANIVFTSLVLCNGTKKDISENAPENRLDRLRSLIQTGEARVAAKNISAYLNTLEEAEADHDLLMILPHMLDKFRSGELADLVQGVIYLAVANSNAARNWLLNHMTDLLSNPADFVELFIFYAQRSRSYDPEFLRSMLIHRDNNGRTFLMLALKKLPAGITETNIRARALELIPRMIEQGADINAQDNNGYTALMYAVERGDTEVADLLLSNGADPYISSVPVSAVTPSAEAAALTYHARQISAITLARGNYAMEEIFTKHLRKPLEEIFPFHGGRKERNY